MSSRKGTVPTNGDDLVRWLLEIAQRGAERDTLGVARQEVRIEFVMEVAGELDDLSEQLVSELVRAPLLSAQRVFIGSSIPRWVIELALRHGSVVTKNEVLSTLLRLGSYQRATDFARNAFWRELDVQELKTVGMAVLKRSATRDAQDALQPILAILATRSEETELEILKALKIRQQQEATDIY
jgi:hypothetical protein